MRRMTHALLMRCASARLDRIRVAAPLRTLERQGIVKITSLLSESNILCPYENLFRNTDTVRGVMWCDVMKL